MRSVTDGGDDDVDFDDDDGVDLPEVSRVPSRESAKTPAFEVREYPFVLLSLFLSLRRLPPLDAVRLLFSAFCMWQRPATHCLSMCPSRLSRVVYSHAHTPSLSLALVGRRRWLAGERRACHLPHPNNPRRPAPSSPPLPHHRYACLFLLFLARLSCVCHFLGCMPHACF